MRPVRCLDPRARAESCVLLGCTFAFLVLALSPRSAVAHGTGILGVASEEGGRLRVLRMAHGLAMLDEQERWRFVCPHTWNDPPAVLALGLGANGGIVVIGLRRAFELSLDGTAEPRFEAGVSALSTRRLIRSGDVVLSLSRTFDGSRVVAFSPGSAHPVLERAALQSIAPREGGFSSVTATTAELRVVEHALDGSALSARTLPADVPPGADVRLERAGAELYAVLERPSEHRLLRLEPEGVRLIASSSVAILGPVSVEEETLFIAGVELMRVRGNELEIVDNSRAYTCLEEGRSGAYACAGPELYRVDGRGRAELVFAMREVRGPRLAQFDADGRVACEFEWNLFASEAGVDPSPPSDPEPPADLGSAPGCTCRATSGGAERLGALLIGLACFLFRRAPEAKVRLIGRRSRTC